MPREVTTQARLGPREAPVRHPRHLPGCQRRGGCGDVRDEKAHRGYRRNGSSCHHCRLRKGSEKRCQEDVRNAKPWFRKANRSRLPSDYRGLHRFRKQLASQSVGKAIMTNVLGLNAAHTERCITSCCWQSRCRQLFYPEITFPMRHWIWRHERCRRGLLAVTFTISHTIR